MNDLSRCRSVHSRAGQRDTGKESCWNKDGISKRPKLRQAIALKSEADLPSNKPSECGQSPLLVMKMVGSTRKNGQSSPVTFKLDDAQLCSSSITCNLKGASKVAKLKAAAAKKKKHPLASHSKAIPHATISMRVSGIKGQPFPYGKGLPEDSSRLTITASS